MGIKKDNKRRNKPKNTRGWNNKKQLAKQTKNHKNLQ